jgi:succinate dehydrogenase / fumarate reductase iron-sulfur subunit
MKVTLHVWRQKDASSPGEMVTYEVPDIIPDMSFLEMLDVLNERLILAGDPRGPIAFDSDCREGICGTCGCVVNGVAHGPRPETTLCQLHMRSFKDGDHIFLEPWRSKAFPVLKDLVVDRSAFDRVIAAGGFISVATGSAPEANSILVSKRAAEGAMDAAACIGCGACVASCPNGAAMLFVSAKIAHLARLPQGQPERYDRALQMVRQMEAEGFGGCTNIRECEAVCPKGIKIDVIAQLNRDFLRAALTYRELAAKGGVG